MKKRKKTSYVINKLKIDRLLASDLPIEVIELKVARITKRPMTTERIIEIVKKYPDHFENEYAEIKQKEDECNVSHV